MNINSIDKEIHRIPICLKLDKIWARGHKLSKLCLIL